MVSQQQGGAAPPQAQPEPVAYAEEDMSRAKVARYLSLEAEANNATDKAMSAATARNDVPLQVQVMIEEAKTDHAFARYNDAYAKFEQAWNLALTVQDAYGAAEAAMGLADVLAENAYYQQAIEWYIKVEDICKSSIGTTSHQYAVLLIHFADVLAKVGRAKESFEFAQQAFNILVQIVAGQSSEQAAYEQAAAFQADLAECFRIFGQAADYAGDAQEAVNQTTKAVEMASAVYGVNHPKVAADFVNLAWIYAYNGQFDRAYQFAEKAQRIVTDLFGYSHPGVCDALEALAGIAAANGDYARAQQYYTKSLTVKTDYYDPRHPSIANTHYSIGGMYRDAGQYDAAIEEFNMALTIYQTAFPNEDHPFVGAALYGLALTYQAAGRHPEAIEKFDSSVDIYKKAYGEASQEVAWVMTKRGISLKADGKTRKACKDFTAAYDILKNLFGEGHNYVTEAASNLEQCPQ
jgi:tetratricopeptide (TPR) repeat protein